MAHVRAGCRRPATGQSVARRPRIAARLGAGRQGSWATGTGEGCLQLDSSCLLSKLESARCADYKHSLRRTTKTGPDLPAPAVALVQIQHHLATQQQTWSDRLAQDPAAFAQLEREVHLAFGQLADRLVASLLVQAAQAATLAEHAKKSSGSHQALARPRNARSPCVCSAVWSSSSPPSTDGPAVRTGKGRGKEGAGLYPELAVFGFSEGSSPALISLGRPPVGVVTLLCDRPSGIGLPRHRPGHQGGPPHRPPVGCRLC